MRNNLILRLTSLLFLCFGAIAADAQNDRATAIDTSSKFVKDARAFGRNETDVSLKRYREGKLSMRQRETIKELTLVVEKVQALSHKGMDTVRFARQLSANDSIITLVKDGIFINKGSIQTHRNLTITDHILKELLVSTLRTKNAVDAYNTNLISVRNTIDSLLSDTLLYMLPEDSVAIMKYFERQHSMAMEMAIVDSSLNRSIDKVEKIQNDVNFQLYQIRSAIEDIDRYEKELSSVFFNREVADIWDDVGYTRPFKEILVFSFAKNIVALRYYIQNNFWGIILMLAVIFIVFVFLRVLKKQVGAHTLSDNKNISYLSLKRPFLTAVVITVNPFQFAFFDTPFIFNAFLWLVTAIALTAILQDYISRHWMKFWICVVVFFIFACLNNLVLQASRFERYLMVILSLAGIVYSCYILLKGKHHELREKNILYFVGLIAVFETAALFFNIFGRYNLSKTLLSSGYISVVIAISFLWTIRLINEGLSLAYEVYRQPQPKSFFINFKEVGRKAPAFFYVLLVLGWAVLVGRNFYSYKSFSQPFTDFLEADRTIGSYTYSIEGVFVFIVIMACALGLSKFVSFFTTDHHTIVNGEKSNKLEVGSWILLIRIFIISTGLFFAFAASGIPLDRITIIIGALGVGIGLGLQGLVHNLVSGLIIAFEKPVNVGDLVEINDKLGTMKSIGFRSSIVLMSNGASVVIANGDLLNDRLTNWTMGKNIKLQTIQVSVAPGSDLELVKQLLLNAVGNDERILHVPAPEAFARSFDKSCIDFELTYWAANIREGLTVQSDLIIRINTLFKEAGIVMPFPQQEIYLHGFPARTGDSK